MYHFSKRSYSKYKKQKLENYDSLAILMKKILVSFGIDKARYHGCALEGNSIQKLLQNANGIYKQFLIEIMTIISDEKVVLILDDQINRYIEICILFDTLFSIVRTPCGEMDDPKLNNLNEIITLCMLKWRNLRLSMKMIKIQGIEDLLFDQIKKN